jgi:hypothetical protein
MIHVGISLRLFDLCIFTGPTTDMIDVVTCIQMQRYHLIINVIYEHGDDVDL